MANFLDKRKLKIYLKKVKLGFLFRFCNIKEKLKEEKLDNTEIVSYDLIVINPIKWVKRVSEEKSIRRKKNMKVFW